MRPLALAFTLVLLLAGCASPSPASPADPGTATATPTGPAPPSSIDVQWSPPVNVASSGPALYLNSFAEPSAAVLPDGTLVVTASGCDKGLPHMALEQVDQCRHSPTFRSHDGGATWERLNQGADSRLADAAPAISDSVVRADAAGRLYYLSMVPDGLLLLRSSDAGTTWTVADVPDAPGRDRPWLAAAGDGQLALSWWEGATLTMASSTDAGDSWTRPKGVAQGGIAHGGLRIVEATGDIFEPFLAEPVEAGIRIAHGKVGSNTWEVLDTGIALPESATLGDAGRIQSMPGLAIAPDGTMLLTWDQEGHGTVVTVVRGYAVAMGSVSRDGGATWSEPFQLGPYNSIMPWPEALPDGSFVVGYYASDLPGDHYYVGSWRYEAVQLRADGKVRSAEPIVVDPEVRLFGGICTGGGLDCLPRGADRSLLDINELVAGPDGRVFAVYGAEDLDNAKASTIRVAASLR